MTQNQDASLSQAQQAYEHIETLLVTLRLAPGEPLQEKTLMEITGLGRTPVREAVQRLSAQGLLIVLPRKGLVVNAMSRLELGRIVEVRRVLERLLVVKAAERATTDQQRALQALAAHISATQGNLEAFLRLDHRFDELLAEACDNPHLVASLAPLQVHCRRLWYHGLGRLDPNTATDLHAALALAVGNGDGAGAVRALNAIMVILENLLTELDSLN